MLDFLSCEAVQSVAQLYDQFILRQSDGSLSYGAGVAGLF